MDSLLVSVLEIQDQPGTQGRPRQIESYFGLKQFEHYLENRLEKSTTGAPHQLYVIQAPSSCYSVKSPSRLKQLLRNNLGAPDDVFQMHQWRQATFGCNDTINCYRLPTTVRPRVKYSLEYYEMWSVEKDPFLSQYLDNTYSNTVKCATTGRQIQCHKWGDSSSWLMVVPQKVTFWAKTAASDNKTVVLCDAPPTIVIANDISIQLNIKAFEGGYHGFLGIPDHALGSTTERPRHHSFKDDLVYYVQTHADLAEPAPDPSALASMFVKKIVASHYCQLLGFVRHQTASMRTSGWTVQRRTQAEIDMANQVETVWSDSKFPDYVDSLGTVLDALGIAQGRDPFEDFYVDGEAGAYAAGQRDPALPEVIPGVTDWRATTPDFLYLHREFRARLADYARMTSSLAALNSMIGGRISILEARTARSLTLVAMLFAPPACVASIFSIPFFEQAGPKFWWYWASAVPLTLLIFLCTWLVHERDVVRRVWLARRPAAGVHVDGGRLGVDAKV